jgi:hypothetical protein
VKVSIGNLKVVLANYTDIASQHFSCARVMRIIDDNLTRRGASIIGKIPVGGDWRNDPTSLAVLERADRICVNGEGTLHHSRRKGAWLLELGGKPSLARIPKVLINSLYQQNPPEWDTILQDFDFVSVRDGQSAKAMTEVRGSLVDFVPDLSLCEVVPSTSLFTRKGIVIGDSVDGKISARLLSFASQLNLKDWPINVVPLTARFSTVNTHKSYFTRLLRNANVTLRQTAAMRGNPYLKFVANEQEYIDIILNSRLSVTRRFHSVCMAIATSTLFIAIGSNYRNWLKFLKIENLITDAGLNLERVVSISDLSSTFVNDRNWDFSPEEKVNITTFLEKEGKKQRPCSITSVS